MKKNSKIVKTVCIVCSIVVISIALGILLSTSGNKIHKKGLKVTDHEKVTIYVFRGDGCPHCEEAIAYFKTIEDEYKDFIQFVTYETWNNTANSELLKTIANERKIQKYGVPFIVIGEKEFIGFSKGSGVGMINYALEQYQSDSYKDEVREIIETTNATDIKSMTLKEIEG